jgi:hypothetical protein
MNNQYFKNIENIKQTKKLFEKQSDLKNGKKIIFIVCYMILIICIFLLCFSQSQYINRPLLGIICIASLIVSILLLKNVVREHIFFCYRKYPYQNTNKVIFERPYSFIQCTFRRNSIEETYTLTNKFISEQDAWDYLLNRIEIEFDKFCIDKSERIIFGYILKEDGLIGGDCDIEMLFEIKSNTQPKILTSRYF